MLVYRRTSIMESSAQTLVNTVNCVGVMGKGLAHAFKEREPAMFSAYKKICEQKLLSPGKLWLWRGSSSWILNFPTKVHWRNPSRIEWVEAGLRKFVDNYQAQKITEISFPQLGCGNGGLDWKEVKPLMERYLSDLPIPVYIHDYTVDVGLPEHLEVVAQTLRTERPVNTSFEDFWETIRRLVSLSGPKLEDISSNEPFAATMRDDNTLVIDTPVAHWAFEKDDLRGIWLGLKSGVVTKKKAGWAAREGGGPLISILSLLPDVRPIEIQQRDGEPEVAVEFVPTTRQTVFARESKGQCEIEWR